MIYLVNQDPGHNKFYVINQPTLKVVITRHGRLGASGRKIKKVFPSSYRADIFAVNKKHEKLKRDYEVVTEDEFKKLNLQAAIVGSANKCNNIGWVKRIRGGYESISDSDLQNPDCKACLLVTVETRKKYDGEQDFSLLFDTNGAYIIDDCGNCDPITKDNELYKFVNKVGQAALLQDEDIDEESNTDGS